MTVTDVASSNYVVKCNLMGTKSVCDEYWILQRIRIRIYSECQLGNEYEYEYIRQLIFGRIRIRIMETFEYSNNIIEYSNISKINFSI